MPENLAEFLRILWAQVAKSSNMSDKVKRLAFNEIYFIWVLLQEFSLQDRYLWCSIE